jgi:hypothetical protein
MLYPDGVTSHQEMMDRAEVIAKAAAWMQARGWKAKLAKKRGGEQSLFEHTFTKAGLRVELLLIVDA